MKTSAQFAVVAVLTFVTVVVAMGATAGEDQRSNTQLNQIVRTLKDRGKGVKSLFVEVAGDVIVPRGCYRRLSRGNSWQGHPSLTGLHL